ncbi:MAG: hypothetical protein A3F72_02730 [Bacteroidetes bacterium RIFCSPLOWO2_12_FULL_35_15]|nr:MAG: hypothetical protein A3F72_02730 [Bacteroidetes bacterium RIFCSPLOWO2_12_FULL_35_15]
MVINIKELNKFAQEKMSINTKESWLAIKLMIEKYKAHFDLQPYNFREIDFSDFSDDCKGILSEIEVVNNEKLSAVKSNEHNAVIDLRAKERMLIEKLNNKIDFKFSNGSYFKLNNKGAVQHLFYFKLLPITENTNVDVIRGIVKTYYGKNTANILAETPTHAYQIEEAFLPIKIKEEDKILGVVQDEKYKICFEICLNNEEKLFGFIVEKDDSENYLFQLIDGFNRQTYNPFETVYPQGKRIGINEADIKSISI